MLLGNIEVIDKLENDERLSKVKSAVEGFKEMRVLLEYCELLGVKEVVFDLSLARGLDYYTGVIYEAVLCGKYYS